MTASADDARSAENESRAAQAVRDERVLPGVSGRISRTLPARVDCPEVGQAQQTGEVPQRRVPAGQREVAGAVLTRSTSGGYSVIHAGDYVGYLHASVGDKFNVYRRTPSSLDVWLGKYRLEDGVEAILRACGRTAGEGRRDAA